MMNVLLQKSKLLLSYGGTKHFYAGVPYRSDSIPHIRYRRRIKHISEMVFHPAQVPEKLLMHKVNGLSSSFPLSCDTIVWSDDGELQKYAT